MRYALFILTFLLTEMSMACIAIGEPSDKNFVQILVVPNNQSTLITIIVPDRDRNEPLIDINVQSKEKHFSVKVDSYMSTNNTYRAYINVPSEWAEFLTVTASYGYEECVNTYMTVSVKQPNKALKKDANNYSAS
jgi:hypothetical protein